MTNSEILALLMPVFGAIAMTVTAFLVKWLIIGPKPKPKQKRKPRGINRTFGNQTVFGGTGKVTWDRSFAQMPQGKAADDAA